MAYDTLILQIFCGEQIMTNYPAEYAPHWSEFDFITAFRIFCLALSIAHWSPRHWALYHNMAVDLPSAWYIACAAWNYALDEGVDL